MTSTKLMLLGILLVLLGMATNVAVVQYAVLHGVSFLTLFQTYNVLVYGAIALFVAGFIVGLIGFFHN